MSTVADDSYLARILGHVAGRDLAEALEDGGKRVEAAARRLGPAGLAKSWGPGKWTGAQILAHLADAELVIGYRARQVLAQQPHTFQEYDEGAFLALYREIDVDAALGAFVAGRRLTRHLVSLLSAEQLQRVGFHPARGNETLETTLRSLAGHTFNHLAQLEKIEA
jgi:hypothetical protein